MGCYSCGSGFHSECVSPVGENCCCSSTKEKDEDTEENTRSIMRKRGRKREANLKDQQSTGRKRAAVLFPLFRDMDCEWKSLKYAGGGKNPIIGCISGKQEARHHGPDKNTLNNEEGNVHRICTRCHNRWHARNDHDYKPENPGKAHDPNTEATTEELLDNELYYRTHTVPVVKED